MSFAKYIAACILLALPFSTSVLSQNRTVFVPGTVLHNWLTPAEKAAGWKLLFDGQTTAGWRGFNQESFPRGGWTVRNGCLMHTAGGGGQSQDGGDIITVDQYENFELQLEWRLAPGGNSGIKYLIVEELNPKSRSGLGFEMQVLDDARHPDAKMGRNGNRTAGSLYDLIPASKDKVLKPVGEFNHVRLIVDNGHVEHWLNNRKVVEYELGSNQLKALIAESKYKVNPRFGEPRRGHILLQDHGDEVCLRNIKIRELPVKGS